MNRRSRYSDHTIKKIAAIREIDPFCYGFLCKFLCDDAPVGVIKNAIIKSATKSHKIADRWQGVFTKYAFLGPETLVKGVGAIGSAAKTLKNIGSGQIKPPAPYKPTLLQSEYQRPAWLSEKNELIPEKFDYKYNQQAVTPDSIVGKQVIKQEIERARQAQAGTRPDLPMFEPTSLTEQRYFTEADKAISNLNYAQRESLRQLTGYGKPLQATPREGEQPKPDQPAPQQSIYHWALNLPSDEKAYGTALPPETVKQLVALRSQYAPKMLSVGSYNPVSVDYLNREYTNYLAAKARGESPVALPAFQGLEKDLDTYRARVADIVRKDLTPENMADLNKMIDLQVPRKRDELTVGKALTMDLGRDMTADEYFQRKYRHLDPEASPAQVRFEPRTSVVPIVQPDGSLRYQYKHEYIPTANTLNLLEKSRKRTLANINASPMSMAMQKGEAWNQAALAKELGLDLQKPVSEWSPSEQQMFFNLHGYFGGSNVPKFQPGVVADRELQNYALNALTAPMMASLGRGLYETAARTGLTGMALSNTIPVGMAFGGTQAMKQSPELQKLYENSPFARLMLMFSPGRIGTATRLMSEMEPGGLLNPFEKSREELELANRTGKEQELTRLPAEPRTTEPPANSTTPPIAGQEAIVPYGVEGKPSPQGPGETPVSGKPPPAGIPTAAGKAAPPDVAMAAEPKRYFASDAAVPPSQIGVINDQLTRMLQDPNTPPEMKQRYQTFQHLINKAEINIGQKAKEFGFDFSHPSNTTPENIQKFVNDERVRTFGAKALFHDPTYKAKFGDLSPEKAMGVSLGIWDKLEDWHKWLVIGGVGLAAIGLLSMMFGGDDDENGGSSIWPLLLGAGGAAAAGFGLYKGLNR